MQAHLQTEAYLKSVAEREKGFTYTTIREGLYAESCAMYTGFPSLTSPPDKVRIPYPGTGAGIAWVLIDDLGEATARLVAQYAVPEPEGDVLGEYENKIVLLSGKVAYGLAETVKVIGDAVGKEIEVDEVSVDEYAADEIVQENLRGHGEGDVGRKWATSFEAVERGECEFTSKRLERLLGREQEAFEAAVRRMVRETREKNG